MIMPRLDGCNMLGQAIGSKPAGPLRKHAYFGGCFFAQNHPAGFTDEIR
jgi:hypothetical protein